MKKFEEFKRLHQFDLPQVIDPPRVCMKLNIPNERYHIRAFWTALYRLTLWNSWEADEGKNGTKVASVWRQVWNEAMASDDTFNCDQCNECISYPPNAPFIEWFPNNPYTEPDLVTEGYNMPAWYSVETQDDFWGTKPGDVATDITRFPPGSLPTIIPASGLPRFRINLTGAALVRLHMVNMIAGSIAQVTIDDDITTARFLDVNRDILAIPPETETVSIEEIEVEGDGAHHIDVIIVSQVNDQIPFLHHGGGLRKVEICGQGADMAYYELRQNPEDNCIVEQRQSPEGEWFEAFRMNNCDCDDKKRYRVNESNEVEESTDGVTWTPAPEADPRLNPVVIFPPIPADGDNSKCEAANSIVALLIDHQQELLAKKEAGAGMTEILGLIVGVLVGLGVITGGLSAVMAVFGMAIAAFFANLEASVFEAAFDEPLWDELTCIFFCRISETGEVTPDKVAGIKTDIEDKIENATAKKWLLETVNLLGSAGLTNAARTGFTGNRSCDLCQCGDLNCGFTTTQHINSSRWSVSTELVDIATFNQAIDTVIQAGIPPFYTPNHNRTLAAFTTFEEPCYITDVTLYTLGRSNASWIAVAYKTEGGGDWHHVGTQAVPPAWSAGVPKVFEINAAVVAIQIQSKAQNAGQNNFSTVTIGDPTP